MRKADFTGASGPVKIVSSTNDRFSNGYTIVNM
jgi:hypothetical protein